MKNGRIKDWQIFKGRYPERTGIGLCDREENARNTDSEVSIKQTASPRSERERWSQKRINYSTLRK